MTDPNTNPVKTAISLSTILILVLQLYAPAALVADQASSANSVNRSIAAPEVTIEQGRIRGMIENEGKEVEVFRGIPYAAPPVGELRWKPPRPPASWDGVRDCREFGPSCPQPNEPLMNLLPMGSVGRTSEDCLYLNVYRPRHTSDQKLPVMVWIHGGGYTVGSASQGLYNGVNLATRGVILVSINYRLGAFGFLAHPALSGESEYGVSGNYGILDQIAALRWIQQNISSFGGDPDQVTIFGESAGGGSVLCLLISPLSEGLFHRAIVQSAPVMRLRHLRRDLPERQAAESFGKELIGQLGHSAQGDANALRDIASESLATVNGTDLVGGPENAVKKAMLLPIAPIVDGHVIKQDPNSVIRNGGSIRVPVIVGHTRDEADLFLVVAGDIPSDARTYKARAGKQFGQKSDAILAAYPPSKHGKNLRSAMSQLLTDLIFAAQARMTARGGSASGQPTYKYLFTQEIRALIVSSAFHGCELPYLFGMDAILVRDDDKQLADTMRQYWINFAATGNPNGPGLPPWPCYQSESALTLELGNNIRVLEKYRHDALDVIDEYLQSQ